MELLDDSKILYIANKLKNGETLEIFVEVVKEARDTENDDVGLRDDEEDELKEVRKNVRDAEMQENKRHQRTKKDTNVDTEIEILNESDALLNCEGKDESKEWTSSDSDENDVPGEYASDADVEDHICPTSGDNKIYYDPETLVPQFAIGMIFDSVKQFRLAVCKYAVVKGVGLKFVKNEAERVRVQCIPACPWRLFASVERNDNTFMVKTYIPNHKCYRVSRNVMANSNFLATLLKERISIQPRIQINEIKAWVRSEFKVHVGASTCRRAKQKVMNELLGDYKLQYAVLHDYVEEVLTRCKEGWIKGCRPILGLDGCFLKSLCEGQLLCAIGRDGNNQIFPVAWAVVSVENKINWAWFLRCLKHDLPLQDGEGYTIISDMQKGLASAIKDELPNIHHRMCARHIYSNWAKKWRGFERKKSFWACAKSTYENQLKKNLDYLDTLGKGCIQDLLHYPVQQWCKCYFPIDVKCDMVDNNVSETFNGWILQARWKPIITMLDEIRRLVMNRFREKREFVSTWICDVSPRAMDKIEKNKKASYNWIMTFNGDDGYEVTNIYDQKDRHVVKLNGRTCSCREWDLVGLPCQHAICAIYSVNQDPVYYVSKWYMKEVYLEAYSVALNPLRGQHQWKKTNQDEILPPSIKPKPGRPKRNRRKDKDEPVKTSGKLSRNGRKMTCSKCKQHGHNKKGCRGDQTTASTSNNRAKIPLKRKENSNNSSQPEPNAKRVTTKSLSSQNDRLIPPASTVLGHEYKNLSWQGQRAVTINQLERVVQHKKSLISHK